MTDFTAGEWLERWFRQEETENPYDDFPTWMPPSWGHLSPDVRDALLTYSARRGWRKLPDVVDHDLLGGDL